MNVTRHAKFVSRKVNKIRWKPKTKRLLNESNVFASGSWDNGVIKACKVYCFFAITTIRTQFRTPSTNENKVKGH